jgi:4-amino-4-deoxy-L-arabinose transferase-like glycosyltransferase
MAELRHFGLADLLLFLVVVVAAAGTRAGYLVYAADGGRSAGPLVVQDPPTTLQGLPAGTTILGHENPTELDALVQNLKDKNQFAAVAPFASGEEPTAHVAPGYPWLLAQLARVVSDESLDRTVRWVQVGLGGLTAGFLFLFARRAFHSLAVATLAGLFAAAYPFWIINTAAINDGTLTAFLLAFVLFLGARAGQTGAPFTSLLYGLGLAALAMVRAALLPFGFVALLWLLLRSRMLPRGWLCALLAFLGFGNGLVPWTLRNYQTFGEPIPVVDSAYYHLWIGNNPLATGGPATEAMLQGSPSDEEFAQLKEDLPKLKQPERYARLGHLVKEELRKHVASTFQRRLQAGLDFFFGERWFTDKRLADDSFSGEEEEPLWLGRLQRMLPAALLVLLILAVLGWRWSYGWRWESLPAALAVLWIPLPYILGHADALSGPRLPLDGVFLCYAAFTLACLWPGLGRDLLAGPHRPSESMM